MISTNVSTSHKIDSTSQGGQEKFCKDNTWYKLDCFGGEGEVEYLVSEILKCSTLNKEDYVVYSKCLIKAPMESSGTFMKEVTGCKSRSFLLETETEVTFNDVFKWLNEEPSTYKQFFDYSIEYFSKFYDLNIIPYLKRVYTIDALTHNTDRHLNNLCIIQDTTTEKCRLAPIFDNGCAFGVQFPNYSKRPLNEYFFTLCPKLFYREGFYKPIDILGLGFQLYEDKLQHTLSTLNVERKYLELLNISLETMFTKYPDFIISANTNQSNTETNFFK